MSLATVRQHSDANPAGFRDISPAAVYPQLAALRLIDVRQPDEFTGPLGHVPGAELVPLSTVGHVAPAWDKTSPILVICRSGGRSAAGASVLVQLGFTQVYNMTGGMIAWDANDLPRNYEAPKATR